MRVHACVYVQVHAYTCVLCMCVHINMASDRKVEQNPSPRYVLYAVMANTVNLT